MAGFYTDNQPDFTHLKPGEVKNFSQTWWPFRKLGPVQQVDERLAIRLKVDDEGRIDAGVAASEVFEGLHVRLSEGDRILQEGHAGLTPGRIWRADAHRLAGDVPEATGTTKELYLTDEHLEQYRHPTRDPERYWEEALRRDPGEFEPAANHL